MDDLDDQWLTELKDLSKHNWHGKLVLNVARHDEQNIDGGRLWDAVDCLQDFPGWDICRWDYWLSDTLWEISWSTTSKESRDAVTQALRGIKVQQARHLYECYAGSGVTIQPWHWKEV